VKTKTKGKKEEDSRTGRERDLSVCARVSHPKTRASKGKKEKERERESETRGLHRERRNVRSDQAVLCKQASQVKRGGSPATFDAAGFVVVVERHPRRFARTTLGVVKSSGEKSVAVGIDHRRRRRHGRHAIYESASQMTVHRAVDGLAGCWLNSSSPSV